VPCLDCGCCLGYGRVTGCKGVCVCECPCECNECGCKDCFKNGKCNQCGCEDCFKDGLCNDDDCEVCHPGNGGKEEGCGDCGECGCEECFGDGKCGEDDCDNCKPVVINYILGDVDGDGDITIGDVLEILKFLAGLESVFDYDDTDISLDFTTWLRPLMAACITPESKKENEPSIADALEILKYLAGLENLIAAIPAAES